MVWPGVGLPFEPVVVDSVTLDDGDLLVAIELAAVCGSDVHTVSGKRDAPTPLVLGHEQIGTVVSGTATAVDGTPVEPGDLVAWSVITACGSCARCLADLPQKCLALRKFGHEQFTDEWQLSGGFASHALVPHGTAIVKLRRDVEPRILVPVACATATVAAALDAASRVVELHGASVLIAGGGMLGLTATAMATDAGARVTLSDPEPSRRELALRFGAVSVVAPGESVSATVALDFSGSASAVEALIGSVDVGGVVVLAGSVFPGPPVALDPRAVVTRLLTIVGVHNYRPADLQSAADFLHDRGSAWPFRELVGEVVPLAEVDRALELARAGASVRVAVRP